MNVDDREALAQLPFEELVQQLNNLALNDRGEAVSVLENLPQNTQAQLIENSPHILGWYRENCYTLPSRVSEAFKTLANQQQITAVSELITTLTESAYTERTPIDDRNRIRQELLVVLFTQLKTKGHEEQRVIFRYLLNNMANSRKPTDDEIDAYIDRLRADDEGKKKLYPSHTSILEGRKAREESKLASARQKLLEMFEKYYEQVHEHEKTVLDLEANRVANAKRSAKQVTKRLRKEYALFVEKWSDENDDLLSVPSLEQFVRSQKEQVGWLQGVYDRAPTMIQET